jgi:predicted nuclease with TOPRIM domain
MRSKLKSIPSPYVMSSKDKKINIHERLEELEKEMEEATEVVEDIESEIESLEDLLESVTESTYSNLEEAIKEMDNILSKTKLIKYVTSQTLGKIIENSTSFENLIAPQSSSVHRNKKRF